MITIPNLPHLITISAATATMKHETPSPARQVCFATYFLKLHFHAPCIDNNSPHRFPDERCLWEMMKAVGALWRIIMAKQHRAAEDREGNRGARGIDIAGRCVNHTPIFLLLFRNKRFIIYKGNFTIATRASTFRLL